MYLFKNLKNIFIARLNYVLIVSLFFFFRFFFKNRYKKDTLIIICIEAIGDYILFRNYLEHLKENAFRNSKITLLGNSLWKEISLYLDSEFVENFIWIDPNALKNSLIKRFLLYLELRRIHFEKTINFSFTRTELSDSIAIATNAKIIYGGLDEIGRRKLFSIRLFNRFYTKLIEVPAIIKNEFDRNKYFFETITNSKVVFQKPYIRFYQTESIIKEKYVVIFPGAGLFQRRWDANNFYSISKKILDNYENISVVLVGDLKEKYISNSFLEVFENPRFYNKIGKTNLIEFVNIIKDCCLLISNESSGIHISTAFNIPTICILGGGHFGRFAPYSYIFDVNDNISIFNQMDCFGCNWQCVYKIEKNKAFPCIHSISIKKVWDSVIDILK